MDTGGGTGASGSTPIFTKGQRRKLRHGLCLGWCACQSGCSSEDGHAQPCSCKRCLPLRKGSVSHSGVCATLKATHSDACVEADTSGGHSVKQTDDHSFSIGTGQEDNAHTDIQSQYAALDHTAWPYRHEADVRNDLVSTSVCPGSTHTSTVGGMQSSGFGVHSCQVSFNRGSLDGDALLMPSVVSASGDNGSHVAAVPQHKQADVYVSLTDIHKLQAYTPVATRRPHGILAGGAHDAIALVGQLRAHIVTVREGEQAVDQLRADNALLTSELADARDTLQRFEKNAHAEQPVPVSKSSNSKEHKELLLYRELAPALRKSLAQSQQDVKEQTKLAAIKLEIAQSELSARSEQLELFAARYDELFTFAQENIVQHEKMKATLGRLAL